MAVGSLGWEFDEPDRVQELDKISSRPSGCPWTRCPQSLRLQSESLLGHFHNLASDGKGSRRRRGNNVPDVQHVLRTGKLKIVDQRSITTDGGRAHPGDISNSIGA